MRLPWKGHAHSFRVRAGMIYCRSYPRASAGTHEPVDPSVAQLPEDHRMAKGFELIDGGSVTSPRGFLAGGVFAGLKSPGEGVLDLGILVSDRPASVAGTFSTNRILSPSVTLSKQRITSGTAMGVVANSGCANCSVGEQGLTDADEMTQLAARHVGLGAEDLCVASTGMIGVELPMALIRQSIGRIELTEDGGEAFARSIMTTDTRPKFVAASFAADDQTYTVGGVAKGVGMIHPDMATMLAFITCDADVEGHSCGAR